MSERMACEDGGVLDKSLASTTKQGVCRVR